MEIVDNVDVFVFKGGKSKPISELTKEELIYAIEFVGKSSDRLFNDLDKLEDKLKQADKDKEKVERKIQMLGSSTTKLHCLWEKLQKAAENKQIENYGIK